MGKITLDEADQVLVKRIIKIREEENRKAGAKATIYGKRDKEDLDIDAYGAEIAFCRMFDLEPDYTVHPRVGGGDCKDKDDNLIDVKNTAKKWPQYFVKSIKDDPDHAVDYYAWMIGKFPKYEYVGHARYTDVMSYPKKWEGEEREAFIVPADTLIKITPS